MDVLLMIRRSNTTIFTDAKESSTVYELKRVVEGILKRPPEEQRLYKDGQLLMTAKPSETVASPASQHELRPQRQLAWPSEPVVPLSPSALIPSPAHPHAPRRDEAPGL
ncbi:elongin-B-like isoform X2 [Podarcis lilfordi]|uniref:Elongin-B-like isoform X2 n=1 Tax=Podarcis lilfordi TaxID=74358 RepID=A0AA35JPS7_9SAUR|nr:elongin-B-like isoform X2 [Podarcis lilfordi]